MASGEMRLGTGYLSSLSPWLWKPWMEGLGLRKALWPPVQAIISIRKASDENTSQSEHP